MKKKILTSKSIKKMQPGGQPGVSTPPIKMSSVPTPPAKPATKSASMASNTASSSSRPKGVTATGPTQIIPAAGAMRKSKSKERSADGNYMKKTVTRETPAGTSSSTKVRRTVQGVLRGAPSVQKYKGGGSIKSKKK
jgi:hypothetical protein